MRRARIEYLQKKGNPSIGGAFQAIYAYKAHQSWRFIKLIALNIKSVNDLKSSSFGTII